IAIAKRVATDATALLIPDATPAWFRGTALMTVVVSGATVIAMPNPTTTIGSKNATQYELVVPDAAKSAKPAAVIVGPTTSGSRAPTRSSKPPDQRDITPMMMVNGRKTVPANVAEYP